MWVIIEVLSDHEKARVFWDRSYNALAAAAKVTKDFLDCLNIVAMIGGDNIKGRKPEDSDYQNRDYNGWTKEVHRKYLLVGDVWGRIVDAGVNAPGNYHASKMALWCGIYHHIAQLPVSYKVACDSAFITKGFV